MKKKFTYISVPLITKMIIKSDDDDGDNDNNNNIGQLIAQFL